MKIRKGLTGLIAGAVVGGAVSSGYAGILRIDSEFEGVNHPDVQIWHWEGAANQDYTFPEGATVDAYSKEGDDKFFRHVFPPESTSTVYTELVGRDLISTVSGTLGFTIVDDTNFTGKPMLADIYDNNGDPVLENINIRDYSDNETTVPLSLSNGEKYDVRVKFIPEPSALVLGLSGVAAGLGYSLKRNRKKQLRTENKRARL